MVSFDRVKTLSEEARTYKKALEGHMVTRLIFKVRRGIAKLIMLNYSSQM